MVSEKTFYDEHPFDWVELYSPWEIGAVLSPLLRQLADSLPKDSLVLDVGCGTGRVLSYLFFRGVRCIGLDRSVNSLGIMVQRYRLVGAVADNGCLPFRDGVADVVVSDGVLHHTDDPPRAFLENCRILREGGLLYLAVYKPGGRYEFLYRYPGSVIRAALKSSLTRNFVHATALPLYYAFHLVKWNGKMSWRGAQNLFYDYFASPHVVFLSRETIRQWCRAGGMAVLAYDHNRKGNVHCFVLKKLGSDAGSHPDGNHNVRAAANVESRF